MIVPSRVLPLVGLYAFSISVAKHDDLALALCFIAYRPALNFISVWVLIDYEYFRIALRAFPRLLPVAVIWRRRRALQGLSHCLHFRVKLRRA